MAAAPVVVAYWIPRGAPPASHPRPDRGARVRGDVGSIKESKTKQNKNIVMRECITREMVMRVGGVLSDKVEAYGCFLLIHRLGVRMLLTRVFL